MGPRHRLISPQDALFNKTSQFKLVGDRSDVKVQLLSSLSLRTDGGKFTQCKLSPTTSHNPNASELRSKLRKLCFSASLTNTLPWNHGA